MSHFNVAFKPSLIISNNHTEPKIFVESWCSTTHQLIEVFHAVPSTERLVLDFPQKQQIECCRLQPVNALHVSAHCNRACSLEERL